MNIEKCKICGVETKRIDLHMRKHKVEPIDTLVSAIETKSEVVFSNRDILFQLLKERLPKIYDREPGGYSEARLFNLVDDICKLK